MGFSTSGAAAIIFVGLLIAVGIAYPVLETAHDRRSTAIDDRDDRALDLRNTAIDVTDVTYDDAEGDGTLIVNVTNTGSTTLSVSKTDLLVDGEYVSTANEGPAIEETTVDDTPDRDLWQPGDTLTIIVDPVEDEPDRVKVVTEHGIAVTITEVS